MAKAPAKLREELAESTKLSGPMDWLAFVLPIACGIALQTYAPVKSAILSWALAALAVVLLFVVMQMLKARFSHRRSPAQVMEDIKLHYYRRYQSLGSLDKLRAEMAP